MVPVLHTDCQTHRHTDTQTDTHGIRTNPNPSFTFRSLRILLKFFELMVPSGCGSIPSANTRSPTYTTHGHTHTHTRINTNETTHAPTHTHTLPSCGTRISFTPLSPVATSTRPEDTTPSISPGFRFTHTQHSPYHTHTERQLENTCTQKDDKGSSVVPSPL